MKLVLDKLGRTVAGEMHLAEISATFASLPRSGCACTSSRAARISD
jgi:hypothetical protein